MATAVVVYHDGAHGAKSAQRGQIKPQPPGKDGSPAVREENLGQPWSREGGGFRWKEDQSTSLLNSPLMRTSWRHRPWTGNQKGPWTLTPAEEGGLQLIRKFDAVEDWPATPALVRVRGRAVTGGRLSQRGEVIEAVRDREIYRQESKQSPDSASEGTLRARLQLPLGTGKAAPWKRMQR